MSSKFPLRTEDSSDGAVAVNKALIIAPVRPPFSLPQSPRRPRTHRRKKTGLTMATLDVPDDEVVKPEIVNAFGASSCYIILYKFLIRS